MDGSSSKEETDDAGEGDGEATSDADTQCDFDSDTQLWKDKASQLNDELVERNRDIYKLREEIAKLRGNMFGFHTIKKSAEWFKFFTGIPTVAVFLWIVGLIKGRVKKCTTKLSAEDHVLAILMKLRLGLLNKDIAYRYSCKVTVISKIYRCWLPKLAATLKQVLIWPSRAEIRANLPLSFQRKYRDCICIIDCSEIFIERPQNLTARAQTWSNYKHNNTIKYLTGISPAGAVMFLSEGWGGRVSDKQITLESGFLSKIQPGDCILADRGFLIEEDLNKKGAYLRIPKFTKGKSQLAAKDVDVSRQLANVRIHVERVIGQLKKISHLAEHHTHFASRTP